MKKLHILFIIICLCLNFVCPAYSADEPIILKVNDALGEMGEQIEVALTIANSGRISAGSFNIVYDTESLELIDCVKGQVFGNLSPNINKAYRPGTIRVSWMAATSVDSGEIIKLTFTALEPGDSEIRIESVKFGTLYAENLGCECYPGTVSVAEAEGEFEITSLTATALDGIKISLSGEELFYDADVFEQSGNRLFIASYDGENRFLNVRESDSFAFEIQPEDGASYTRIFCWNEFKPVTKDVCIDDKNAVRGFLKDGVNEMTVGVSNATGSIEEFRVYVAEYDCSGVLIASDILDEQAEAHSESDIAFDVNVGAECETVKVFVWNKNGAPLSKNIVLGR